MLFASLKDFELLYNLEQCEILSILQETIKEELNLRYDVFIAYNEDNSSISFYECNINNTERKFRITKSRYKAIKKKLEYNLHTYSIAKQNNYYKDKILYSVLAGEVVSTYKGGYLVKCFCGTCKLPYNQIPIEQLSKPLKRHSKMYFYVHKIIKYKDIKNEIFLKLHNIKIVKKVIQNHLKKEQLQKIIYKKNCEVLVVLKTEIADFLKNIISNDLSNYKINFVLAKGDANGKS